MYVIRNCLFATILCAVLMYTTAKPCRGRSNGQVWRQMVRRDVGNQYYGNEQWKFHKEFQKLWDKSDKAVAKANRQAAKQVWKQQKFEQKQEKKVNKWNKRKYSNDYDYSYYT